MIKQLINKPLGAAQLNPDTNQSASKTETKKKLVFQQLGKRKGIVHILLPWKGKISKQLPIIV